MPSPYGSIEVMWLRSPFGRFHYLLHLPLLLNNYNTTAAMSSDNFSPLYHPLRAFLCIRAQAADRRTTVSPLDSSRPFPASDQDCS